MADPTYSLAGLQTELNALITACEAGDWAGARIKLVRCRAVRAGLPAEVVIDGGTAKFDQALESFAALIEDAEDAAASSDPRRIIATRVSHGF